MSSRISSLNFSGVSTSTFDPIDNNSCLKSIVGIKWYSKIEGLQLVAHNKSFDETCLKAPFLCYQMDYPDYEFHCTYQASKRAFPHAVSHKLDCISRLCGYRLENHHHALADAEACAWIAREIL